MDKVKSPHFYLKSESLDKLQVRFGTKYVVNKQVVWIQPTGTYNIVYIQFQRQM